jgi:ATP-dependent helicase HepA
VITVGQFVRVTSNRLGVGKIVSESEGAFEVEYFDSVAATGRERVHARPGEIEPVQLSLQRRCYWLDGDQWRVGRIVWQGANEYGVRPPGSESDLRVAERDLFVRWAKPIVDPIDVLVAKGSESPHFHQCRQPFVRSIIQQRAASRGMHAVLSSVVELHDHQLEVVRRVLEDPRQRYLLADEVGLGKTIEAGLIMRQYLLDHPDGHVVVIVPPMLRRQWVSELREKFMADDFERAVISVLGHDQPERWRAGGRDNVGNYRPHTEAGLLVVDEVHNIASGGDSARYVALSTLAHAVPRLLLLSATPLLHNEDTFLRMLHLLDPDVYRLDDVDGFRRRVQDRQTLGRAFFTFRSDVPSFILREKVGALRGMFDGDAHLAGLLDQVERSLDDRDALALAVTAARVHISETYRVHHRLLRTRRSDSLVASFPVRGRGIPELFGDPGPNGVDEWLDDWRDYLRSNLEDEDDLHRTAARAAIVAMLERAPHLPLLQACARYRLDPTTERAEEAELDGPTRDALRAIPVDATERGILERSETLESEESAAYLFKPQVGARRRTVVFTTFASHARNVAASLIEHHGERAVATHITGQDPAEVEEGLDRFRDKADPCWLLVCDRSAEEGRNLQFADLALHLDMPLSPNRMEQRIGRVDRYGRGSLIPTLAPAHDRKSLLGAWQHCLTAGFHVFDGSIASLQFAIDSVMPGVIDRLLDDGADGLNAATTELPAMLERERVAIAEQDALDAIESGGQIRRLTAAIDDLEDMWFGIQRATEALLCEHPGNLRFSRVIDHTDDKFRSYRLTPPGKTVHLNSMPLVAWDVLRTSFRSVINRPGTYFRRSAIGRPYSRLFRVGEPFIDALADYMHWDDRGQTFSFWRTARAAIDDRAYFRFDYIVEAEADAAVSLLRTTDSAADSWALRRRADSHLAPRLDTIWTDVEGIGVTDDAVLEILERPYDPSTGDLNLNVERRWAVEQLIGEVDWEARCRSARARSEADLRTRGTFSAAAEAAVASFGAAARAATLKRQTRLAVLDSRQRAREEQELEVDQRIDAALELGLAAPRVRLDAVGIVVLSARTPTGPGFPRLGQ